MSNNHEQNFNHDDEIHPDSIKADESYGNYESDAESDAVRHGEESCDGDHGQLSKENTVNELCDRGLEYYENENYDAALECVDEALTIAPNDADLLHNKASCLQAMARHEEAVDIFMQMLETNPDDVDVLYDAAWSLYKVGNTKEALRCITKLLQKEPEHIEGLLSKGFILERERDYEDARACYELVLTHDPTNVDALYRMGECYYAEGNCYGCDDDYKLAIEWYDKAADQLPQPNSMLLELKYRAWIDMECYVDALDCLDQIIEIDPQDAGPRTLKAQVLSELKRFDEAMECINEAVAMAPGDSTITDTRDDILKEKKNHYSGAGAEETETADFVDTADDRRYFGVKDIANGSFSKSQHVCLRATYGQNDGFTDEAFSNPYYLKTYKAEFLADQPEARTAFKEGITQWLNMPEHPFILEAKRMDEIDGDLSVLMEYVEADRQNRTSLADYLKGRARDRTTKQTLCWAIQFCRGMEHAHKAGITCHGNIKPSNILIRDDRSVAITDFGIAAAVSSMIASKSHMSQPPSTVLNEQDGPQHAKVPSRPEWQYVGTPEYMAPEVYRMETIDTRSDVYSFGVVLCELAQKGALPSLNAGNEAHMNNVLNADDRTDVDIQHTSADAHEEYVQQIANLAAKVRRPLGPIIQQCLQEDPAARYADFTALRQVLEALYKKQTGQTVPDLSIDTRSYPYLCAKGGELARLGDSMKAYQHLRRAMRIAEGSGDVNTQFMNPELLNSIGHSLFCMEQYQLAVFYHLRAWRIDQTCAREWKLFGQSSTVRACEASITAMALLRNVGKRLQENVRFYVAAYLRQESMDADAVADWEAAKALLDEGKVLHENAKFYLAAYLRQESMDADAVANLGVSEAVLGDHSAALKCFGRVRELAPKDVSAQVSYGVLLYTLGCPEEALSLLNAAVEIDGQCIQAYFYKALVEAACGMDEKAIESWTEYLRLAQDKPGGADPEQVAEANKRLAALREKNQQRRIDTGNDEGETVNK